MRRKTVILIHDVKSGIHHQIHMNSEENCIRTGASMSKFPPFHFQPFPAPKDPRPMVSNVLPLQGLGKLNGEELQELSQRLRAVGFGPGHTCALRQLCSAASATWQHLAASARPGMVMEWLWPQQQGCSWKNRLQFQNSCSIHTWTLALASFPHSSTVFGNLLRVVVLRRRNPT